MVSLPKVSFWSVEDKEEKNYEDMMSSSTTIKGTTATTIEEMTNSQHRTDLDDEGGRTAWKMNNNSNNNSNSTSNYYSFHLLIFCAAVGAGVLMIHHMQTLSPSLPEPLSPSSSFQRPIQAAAVEYPGPTQQQQQQQQQRHAPMTPKILSTTPGPSPRPSFEQPTNATIRSKHFFEIQQHHQRREQELLDVPLCGEDTFQTLFLVVFNSDEQENTLSSAEIETAARSLETSFLINYNNLQNVNVNLDPPSQPPTTNNDVAGTRATDDGDDDDGDDNEVLICDPLFRQVTEVVAEVANIGAGATPATGNNGRNLLLQQRQQHSRRRRQHHSHLDFIKEQERNRNLQDTGDQSGPDAGDGSGNTNDMRPDSDVPFFNPGDGVDPTIVMLPSGGGQNGLLERYGPNSFFVILEIFGFCRACSGNDPSFSLFDDTSNRRLLYSFQEEGGNEEEEEEDEGDDGEGDNVEVDANGVGAAPFCACPEDAKRGAGATREEFEETLQDDLSEDVDFVEDMKLIEIADRDDVDERWGISDFFKEFCPRSENEGVRNMDFERSIQFFNPRYISTYLMEQKKVVEALSTAFSTMYNDLAETYCDPLNRVVTGIDITFFDIGGYELQFDIFGTCDRDCEKSQTLFDSPYDFGRIDLDEDELLRCYCSDTWTEGLREGEDFAVDYELEFFAILEDNTLDDCDVCYWNDDCDSGICMCNYFDWDECVCVKNEDECTSFTRCYSEWCKCFRYNEIDCKTSDRRE